ncbi:hypothetical protein ACRALDRAFT_1066047 [Sodiomyces alcalophilus JCM 7366]|uniref:uncharacterized protein n=1 Tax=Sodiomyces alcalophilus JCM 7366 TaxID=591952 RepID=UPI0039B6DAFE
MADELGISHTRRGQFTWASVQRLNATCVFQAFSSPPHFQVSPVLGHFVGNPFTRP